MLITVFLIPFSIILLVILLIFGLRTKGVDKGDEAMKSIYVYLVLFATLMMSIGGSIGVFMALADVVSPAPYHQSFEEYRQWGAAEYMDEEVVKKKTEEELVVSYEAMIKRDKEQSEQQAINALIKSFGWIVIPLPIFIYFQRRLGKQA